MIRKSFTQSSVLITQSFLLFLLVGCAGPSSEIKKALNKMIADQNFAAAEAELQKVKLTAYGQKNAVLYNLDMGTVLHHAGRYRESDDFFDKAENRMQELYTKSATKAAGTLMLNDNTMDYAGESFERALTNVFRALNYVFLGLPDEALVESRKVEVYLDELNQRIGKKRVYKDDAFARYLDSLLYADAGKSDDARISWEAAQAAYAWYAKDYNLPESPLAPPEVPAGKGEIVFIHYNGVAPRKISKTFQVAWGQGLAAVNAAKEEGDPQAVSPQFQNALRAGVLGNAITVAYPEYVQDPYAITASEVEAGDAASPTALVEDVSAIAFKDLKDRMAAIKTRAIARAMVKYVLARAATKAAEDKYGKNSWQAIMTNIGTNTAAAATEIADTRAWNALPSQIRLARLRVSPGTHDVVVTFRNAAGDVVSTKTFSGVSVSKGRRTYLAYRTAI